MIPDSRQTIYIGINFVLTPAPPVDAQTNLRFQQSLTERGIDYGTVTLQGDYLVIQRPAPDPVLVRVGAARRGPVGQWMVVHPGPAADLELFIREVEAIGEAFVNTWGANHQIITSDVTLRDLFESSSETAFQELWEDIVGQPAGNLDQLGGDVRGGGLRLVVAPENQAGEPTEIQVRVESFLKDRKKLWVETIFKWTRPGPLKDALQPRQALSRVSDYVDSSVVEFLTQGLDS